MRGLWLTDSRSSNTTRLPGHMTEVVHPPSCFHSLDTVSAGHLSFYSVLCRLRTPECRTRKTSREAIIALDSMATADGVGYCFVFDAVRISRPWNPHDDNPVPFSLAVGGASTSSIITNVNTKYLGRLGGLLPASFSSFNLFPQSALNLPSISSVNLLLQSTPSISSFNLLPLSPPIFPFDLLLQSPPSLLGKHLFAASARDLPAQPPECPYSPTIDLS